MDAMMGDRGPLGYGGTSATPSGATALLGARTAQERARALQKLCAIEFEADPDVEVGKVQRSRVDPGAWFFHVYVMRTVPEGRHVLRSNIVVATEAASAVTGPDEVVIAAALRAPL